MVQEAILFKDISYLQLWLPSCMTERIHLGNFGRGHYEEHFCKIIFNLVWLVVQEMFKIFLIWSSDSRLVRFLNETI